jgi:outer membrane protein/protease secretion system outer membrane protein
MLNKIRLLTILFFLSHIPNVLAIDLYQAYELSVVNDPTLNAAKSKSKSDQESLSQAKAQLMPNVTFNFNRSKISQTRTQGEVSFPRQEFFSTGQNLTLKQPIFRKNLFSQYEFATAEYKNAEDILGNNFQELSIRLVGAYFDLLFALDKEQLVKSQLELYSEQLRYSAEALKAGLGVRTDLDAYRARLNQAIADEIEISQNIDFFRQQLSQLVGENVENIAPLNELTFDPMNFEIKTYEEWLAEAIDRNFLLASYKSKIDMAEASIKIAESGHYPSLDFVAQYNKSDSENLFFQGTTLSTSSLGFQLSVPIYSGGYVNSRSREANADFDEASYKYLDLINKIKLDVRKNYNILKQGQVQISALNDLVRSDEQLVVSNKKGYQAGNRTSLDILNSENKKFESILKLKEARYSFLKAWVTLNSYVSRTNSDFFVKINTNFVNGY